LKKDEMGLFAGLACASATGFVDWRVWRGLEGDLETLVLVEFGAFGLGGGRLAGLVSVGSWTVGTESSSSSSDDKMVILRRGRPWAMLPVKSCL
jgi:hypothetical protein